jgi:hypothetical protein
LVFLLSFFTIAFFRKQNYIHVSVILQGVVCEVVIWTVLTAIDHANGG